MITRMADTVADRIRQRLAETGISAHAASLKAGGSASLIPNILLGRSASPRVATLQKIAEALDTSTEWLLGDEEKVAPTVQTPTMANDEVELIEGPPTSLIFNDLPMTIPILGTALGSVVSEGIEGFQFEPGEVIGYVRRPTPLAKIREAYALLIRGDSMDPMHPPNQVRVINPLRPCEPGDSVIVITRQWADDPGQAYIKILRRRTEHSVVLEQLNPRSRFEIPRQHVAAIHYVLTMNDLLGF